MRILLSAVLLAISISAHSADIFQTVNKFTGNTHYFSKPQDTDLDGGSFFTMRYVLVSIHAFKPVSDIEHPFVLSFATRTPQWIFIRGGESLHLLLDGTERIALTGPGSGSSRDIESSTVVTERAGYFVTPEQMRKIGAASVVEFQMSGDKQVISGKFTKATIDDARLWGEKGEGLLGLANAPSSEPIKLGVQFLPLDDKIRKAISYADGNGAFVLSVTQGGVASAAGLMSGDVITSFGDKKIATIEDLQQSVAATKRGQSVKITVWRQGAEQAITAQF